MLPADPSLLDWYSSAEGAEEVDEMAAELGVTTEAGG